jgi:hypothetical protein
MVFGVELLVAAKSGINAADSVCSMSLQVRVGAFYARHARFLLRGSTAAAHCGVGGTRGSHCAAVAAVIAAWVAHAACGQAHLQHDPDTCGVLLVWLQLATKNLDLPTMQLLLREEADVAAAGEASSPRFCSEGWLWALPWLLYS